MGIRSRCTTRREAGPLVPVDSFSAVAPVRISLIGQQPQMLSAPGGSLRCMDEDDEPSEQLPAVTVDAAIADFLLLEQARASGARRRRLELAVEDLRQCFEAVADRVLTTSELATRDLERQFRAEDAAARVASADALLHVLPVWLEESRWHGDDLEDRRLRVQLTVALARFVERLPTFDGIECALLDVDAAVERARREIREARRLVGSGS